MPSSDRIDDICPRYELEPPRSTRPAAPPIYLASVYQCESIEQADTILGGRSPGYVYQRDGQPNADYLAERCRKLHGAAKATVTSSGMSALSLAFLATLRPGDHVLYSKFLYGKTVALLTGQFLTWGVTSTAVDITDLAAVRAAMTKQTKLLLAETIANPLLHVADLTALTKIAAAGGAKVLIDNTFATPLVCRPHEFGADLVMESLTKMMSGHADVILGLLTSRHSSDDALNRLSSTWGMTPGAFDCWIADRGLVTMHLRVDRACQNALAAAEFLSTHSAVSRVSYPGLKAHAQYQLAKEQFGGRFGSMVAFDLVGGLAAASKFITKASRIPFCPSLGDATTSLSHPVSTSHRSFNADQLADLSITPGTIRLSVGIESPEFVVEILRQGLRD
jgi:cystathionine beta-lyase/cystathionine gamma-synthase